MSDEMSAVVALIFLVCGIVSAKWAMELGFSQSRQLLWAAVGLLLGPVGVLLLYIRSLRMHQAHGLPGGRWW
jgi:hypothetical protein